jgi:hypothetical protein
VVRRPLKLAAGNLSDPGVGARYRNAAAASLGPTIPTSDTGVVVAELDEARARLLDTIDDALKVRPSASKRIMELARAYESLSQSSPPLGV